MNGWLGLGTFVWFVADFLLTVMALVCAMDDTEPDLGFAVFDLGFAVLLLILIWGGFIAFCLHMGGAW